MKQVENKYELLKTNIYIYVYIVIITNYGFRSCQTIMSQMVQTQTKRNI